MPAISSNCSGPATSGGEIWTTGSPRSSARQIRPRSKRCGERKSRSSHSHSSSENVSFVSLSLTSSSAQKKPAPRRSPAIVEIEQLAERRAKALLVGRDVLDDPLALHDLDVLEGDRALHRMAAEGHPVRVHVRVREERLHDRVSRDHGADDAVRGGEPLRGGHEVGPDVVPLGAEPGAHPAEARDHLVGAEQDAVAVADLADALEVPGRRRERAARVLHRLHDHHGHGLRPGLLDRRVEVLEQHGGELLLGLPVRTVVAVRVADVERSGTSGSNGALIAAIPLIESAPRVVP